MTGVNQIPTTKTVMKQREEVVKATDPVEKAELLGQYRMLMHQFGASIHPESVFEGPPFFPHGLYGVFISRGARIGNNCIIFQQVTIGSNLLVSSSHAGFPILGDNVLLGSGAKVIGKVTIGNNVLIGANTTVVRDVPDNSVVVTGGTRIIPRKKVDTRYFSRHAELGWAYYQDGGWVRDLCEYDLRVLENIE